MRRRIRTRRGMRRVVAALLLLALPAIAADPEEESDLERLRRAIESSRERVALYEREERGLLEALEAIEESAELLQREVVRARSRAQSARAELARTEQEAKSLSARLATLEVAMGARARALYQAGELGAIPMLFSAGDLREFLGRVQALRLLLVHDAELLERHRRASASLLEARTLAARAAEDSRAAERTLTERSRQLGAERERKRVLVLERKRSRARERSALAELETAGRALEEAVASMPSERLAAFRPEAGSFAALRGRLRAPVDVPIARGFGRVVDDASRTTTIRKGVEYDAPSGALVRAVAAGRVRYAGRFRGYGKTVIVDHGDDYFTVSSHLDRMRVSVGDAVAAGDPIGEVGDTGSLSGPQLYFELRRGKEALDPAAWLSAGDSAGRR